MNIDNTGSIPSTAEEGIEASDIEAENRIKAQIECALQDYIRFAAERNMPSRSVFCHWKGYACVLNIFALDPANLPGSHAGSEGE